MLLSLEGNESSGKTTLAYSAPLPIVGFAFDMGFERAVQGGRYNELFKGLRINTVPYDGNPEGKVWDDVDITVFELPQPIQLDSIRVVGCQKLWQYFIQLCARTLSDPRVRTVVIDTMTVARRVKASAYLEGLQGVAFDNNGNRKSGERLREKLIQIEYGSVNDAIRDIYTSAAGVKVNLVATHHLTDERKDHIGKDGQIEQVLTGNKLLEGLAGTHRFVDIAIRMEKAEGKLSGKFLKCGYNLSQEGTTLTDPTWDGIANLVAMGTGDRVQLDRRVAVEVS